jgi:Asp/Glu/hydantoin racemase
MPVYHVDPNPHRVHYGTTLGVLVMKSRVPCIPGSVSNASTYPYPVIHRVVEGLDVQRLVREADPTLLEPILREARELERAGVSAISSDCGYMALFQKQVAAQLSVPVCLTSLLQVPFIHSLLPASKRVGIVVADSRSLRPQALEAVGVTPSMGVVIAGMEGQPAFDSAIMEENGTLDSDAIEEELISVCQELLKKHPDVGALLLECSEFPAYSAAVQAAVGRPVFDFMTMLDYVHGSLVRKRYHGTFL